MRKIYFLFGLIFVAFIGNAQIVNIPDANFKSSLLSYIPAIDTNSDNEIQVSEALAVTSLDFLYLNSPSTNAQDLTGIEAFANLTSLNISSFYNLQSLNLSSLSNLQSLICSNCYNMTSLNVTGLSNLQTLNCSFCYHLISLDTSTLTNLTVLNASNCLDLTSINVSGLSNLQTLNCSSGNHLTALDLTGLNQLQTLNCSDSQITSLDLTGLSNLTFVDASRGRLTSINTTGANNILHFDCSSNELTSLVVTGMTNLQYLNCGFQQNYSTNPVGSITNLDLTGLNSLTYLNCNSNGLTSLNVAQLTNLTYLNCNYNQITSLNIAPLVNLTELYCGGNLLSSLDVSSLTHLTQMDCHGNQLAGLNIDNLTNLNYIDCGQNLIPSLNVSNNNAMTFLACAGNHLTTLSISNLVNLTDLICSSNQLTTLDVSNLHHLTRIEVGWNLFTELDFSQSIIPGTNNFSMYSFAGNPNLSYINLKNGIGNFGSNYSLFNCPVLQYICADEGEIQYIQQELGTTLGSSTPTNVQVNSYCTFVPGGIHNTISGTVTLDNNNNGCDSGDIRPRDFRIDINDGTLTGATFSTTTGNYSFFTQAGSFTLTPHFENPFFTITPSNTVINSPNLDGSTQTQDFCITANGIHNDVDIVIIPLGGARPGFDAHYALIYKNKGNQIISGDIDLAFDDGVFDLVSANPNISGQSPNHLNWSYTNLLPFESRTIDLVLNLNGPMENPAVNIGDVLNFTAVINPVSGDETTEDNSFQLQQIVTGSYDPNDKTCVEGNFIRPENVGDYLHYVIRFQNSGTAPAENIVVSDVIDTSKFEMSSLQLTSASHPQVTRITGNRVEFFFEGINLPAEIDNEPGSHGYVAFKIKTKNNLVLGNSLANTADIYFDFNFPITTNTATTTVSNLSNHEVENTSVSISPNPVKNIVSVTSKDSITSIQLFDVQGRLISTKLDSSLNASLDLSTQQSGFYFIKVSTEKGIKIQKIIKE